MGRRLQLAVTHKEVSAWLGTLGRRWSGLSGCSSGLTGMAHVEKHLREHPGIEPGAVSAASGTAARQGTRPATSNATDSWRLGATCRYPQPSEYLIQEHEWQRARHGSTSTRLLIGAIRPGPQPHLHCCTTGGRQWILLAVWARRTEDGGQRPLRLSSGSPSLSQSQSQSQSLDSY